MPRTPLDHRNICSSDEAGGLRSKATDILPISEGSCADRSPFTSTKYHKAATANEQHGLGHLVNPWKTALSYAHKTHRLNEFMEVKSVAWGLQMFLPL